MNRKSRAKSIADDSHLLSSGDGDSDYVSGIEDMDEALEVLGAEDLNDYAIVDLAVRAGLTYKFLSYQYLSRLLASLAFCFVAAYINTLASVCAGYRTPWLLVRVRHLCARRRGRVLE